MPADARTLLRAAASERAKSNTSGISDPFASYSSTGGLRCSACNYLTIKHESLWGAHALSKSHRANVTRIREEELRQAELQRTKEGKRKAVDAGADIEEHDGPLPSNADGGDVKEDAAPESNKARTDTAIDPEWELFKSQMEAPEPEPDPSASNYSAGAALEAEAQLISQDDADLAAAEDGVEEKSKEKIEAEERARKEQEEREEILSRLEEEQRQQDEADQR